MHGFEFTSQILEQHGTNIIVLTLNYADFEISTSVNSVFFSAQKQRTSRTSCIYRGSEENNTQLHCGALSAAFKINFGICIDFQSGGGSLIKSAWWKLALLNLDLLFDCKQYTKLELDS